ncbi:hypothetical protein QJQ45_011181 [Haematococcus lacustris]|nr:hypothetical protein QJQ45_011181 [Haematococcus lacustris]
MCRQAPAPALCWAHAFAVDDYAEDVKSSIVMGLYFRASACWEQMVTWAHGVYRELVIRRLVVVMEAALPEPCLALTLMGDGSCRTELSEELQAAEDLIPSGWLPTPIEWQGSNWPEGLPLPSGLFETWPDRQIRPSPSPSPSPAPDSPLEESMPDEPLPEVREFPEDPVPEDPVPEERIPEERMPVDPVPEDPVPGAPPAVQPVPGHSAAAPSGSGPIRKAHTVGLGVGLSVAFLLMLAVGLRWRYVRSAKASASSPPPPLPTILFKGPQGAGSEAAGSLRSSMLSVHVQQGSAPLQQLEPEQQQGRLGNMEGAKGDSLPGSPVCCRSAGYGTSPSDPPPVADVQSLVHQPLSSLSPDALAALVPAALTDLITDATPIMPSINLNVCLGQDLKLGRFLGAGALGTVRAAMYRGEEVAVKLFPPCSDLSSFAAEIRVLGRTQHPNIVRLLGASFNSSRVALVEELCLGSLEGLMYPDESSLPPVCPWDEPELQHQLVQAQAPGPAPAAAALLPTAPPPPNTPHENQDRNQPQANEQVVPTPAVPAAPAVAVVSPDLPQLQGALPMHVVLQMALEVAQGLAYLHPTIVHRDLKPANILLASSPLPSSSLSRSSYAPSIQCSAGSTSNPQLSQSAGKPAGGAVPLEHLVCKLSDFGLARMKAAITMMTNQPFQGTVPYMAPELFSKKPGTELSHKCETLRGVFVGISERKMHCDTHCKTIDSYCVLYQIIIARKHLPFKLPPERCHPQLLRLVKRCLDFDPRRRPSALEIVRPQRRRSRHCVKQLCKTLRIATQQPDLKAAQQPGLKGGSAARPDPATTIADSCKARQQ